LMGTIGSTIRGIRESMPDKGGRIEVEVDTSDGAGEAARSGADIIMLDNMSVEDVREAVIRLEKEGLREKVALEVSGGMRFDNIEAYAQAGVDIISMGILTNSSHAMDMTFKIRRA